MHLAQNPFNDLLGPAFIDVDREVGDLCVQWAAHFVELSDGGQGVVVEVGPVALRADALGQRVDGRTKPHDMLFTLQQRSVTLR